MRVSAKADYAVRAAAELAAAADNGRPLNKIHLTDPAQDAELEAFLEGLLRTDVDLGQTWGIQYGSVLAPSELAVGVHSLQVVVSYLGDVLFDSQTPFTIHPIDSEFCSV